MESGTLLTTVGRAGVLFGKAWPRLLAVFLIAQLAHRGLQWVAVQAGAKADAAGIAVLALLVVVSLAMYVAMFLVLRGELPFHRRAVSEGMLAPDGMEPGKENRPVDALAAALLPFLAFYAAYKFLQAEALDYEYQLAVHQANETVAKVLNGGTADAPATGLESLSTWLFIGLGVTAYLLRLPVQEAGRQELGGPVRRLFVTYLEALWIFVVIYQATSFIPSPKSWLKERQVWVWMHDAYIWALDHALGVAKVREIWDAVTGFLAAGIGDLWSAAVLPLMWITMTAVIYGRAVHKPEKIAAALAVRPDHAPLGADPADRPGRRELGGLGLEGPLDAGDGRVPAGRPVRAPADAGLLPGLGGRHLPGQLRLDLPARLRPGPALAAVLDGHRRAAGPGHERPEDHAPGQPAGGGVRPDGRRPGRLPEAGRQDAGGALGPAGGQGRHRPDRGYLGNARYSGSRVAQVTVG